MRMPLNTQCIILHWILPFKLWNVFEFESGRNWGQFLRHPVLIASLCSTQTLTCFILLFCTTQFSVSVDACSDFVMAVLVCYFPLKQPIIQPVWFQNWSKMAPVVFIPIENTFTTLSLSRLWELWKWQPHFWTSLFITSKMEHTWGLKISLWHKNEKEVFLSNTKTQFLWGKAGDDDFNLVKHL